MSYLSDSTGNETGLPVVGKCRSKNGSPSSTSESGGCACKRRALPAAAADEPPHAAAPAETATILAATEVVSETAIVEETPPPGAACGCDHHEAEATAHPAEAPAGGACKCQKLLWIRRTHSACGLIFGAFLVEHLAATALGLQPTLFGRYMGGVHAALRPTPWLEVLVFLPLAALVPFGLYLLAKAGLRYDVKKCKRGGKLRFFLQRVSAVVILGFVAFHLLTLRNWGPRFVGAEASVSTAADSPQTAFATSVRQVWDFLPAANAFSPMRFAVIVFYLLGTTAAVYHFTNGLWTGAIAWGLSSSAAWQQRSLWLCTVLGSVLLVLGALGWYAFILDFFRQPIENPTATAVVVRNSVPMPNWNGRLRTLGTSIDKPSSLASPVRIARTAAAAAIRSLSAGNMTSAIASGPHAAR
jgi:succinate dehydrogenase / fumarate reductase cytochrome b subunit